jgi:hypothetical protein
LAMSSGEAGADDAASAAAAGFAGVIYPVSTVEIRRHT